MTAESKKRDLSIVNGYWSKKIKGKRHYFGKEAGEKSYQEAIQSYLEQRLYLEAGVPIPDETSVTLEELVNDFLTHKKRQLAKDELSERTYKDYLETGTKILEALPRRMAIDHLTPAEFTKVRDYFSKGKRVKTISSRRLNMFLQYARTIFRYAATDHKFTAVPLPYTTALRAVPKKSLRKYEDSRPKRFLEAEHIRAVIDAANPQMKAMVMLAINGGWNNSDISQLEVAHVKQIRDDHKLIEYKRRKTWVERLTPLWDETIIALQAALEDRIRSNQKWLFLVNGKEGITRVKGDHISWNFCSLLKKCEIYQPGRNFGALRTTFANVGRYVQDDLAVKALMGHEDGSTLYQNYVHEKDLPRLTKVTDYVHQWLFKKT